MSDIKLFESKQIRTEWNETLQKWYFAVIDVIEILTESNNPRRYWSDLKRKLNSEGFSQLYEIIVQLKMISLDGKKYITDYADAMIPFKQISSKENYKMMVLQPKYIG